MKGVILAGGTGSRLFPLTKVTNKHLLPVGKYPMILHPVRKLVEAGIVEILVVTGVEHMGDVVNLLGSGKEYGCRFTYKVQDQAGGIAEALGLAEEFCANSKIIVMLGDNIIKDELSPYIESYKAQERGAKILLKEVKDPHRFGVAEIVNGKIVGIEEKPAQPKSSFAVTGIYFYDNEVFKFIKNLKPSSRGELEISDVNNGYILQGKMTFDILKGDWTDAGTFESLHRANCLAYEDLWNS